MKRWAATATFLLISNSAVAAFPGDLATASGQAADLKWQLTSCQLNNMGCRSEGKYQTSGSCETARKAYLKKNSKRTAGCMKIAG